MIANFTISDTNRSAFCAKVIALPLGELYVANVKPRKSKRSGGQNDLYWELCTDFGNHLGYTKNEMHQEFGYKFLLYDKNGKDFIKSTTDLNTQEFSEYFENCLRLAAEEGYVFETYG